MNNSVGVQIFQGLDYLDGVALYFEFVKPLPSLEQFVHALILAKLQQDVDAFAVFEEVLELAYILVLDGPVDFDLTHKLLFCSAFDEV